MHPRENFPEEPKRIKTFARFFKNYMSVSTIIVAALPIPVTSLQFIPTFSQQTKILSVYTSLFCFLILGFIFYSRHSLARILFPEYFGLIQSGSYGSANFIILFKRLWKTFVIWLPLILIICSLYSIYLYDSLLDISIDAREPIMGADSKSNDILQNTEFDDIPNSGRLMLTYIAIFIFAETAFILMAMKEYLQDLLGFSEKELILGFEPTRIKVKDEKTSESINIE